MGKHVALVLTLLLLFAGLASSAASKHHRPDSKRSTAVQRERRLGPTPTPHWYWRWVRWHLGEGFAKSHPRRPALRPKRAPHRIPRWAWRRLHFFLLARASASKGRPKKTHGKPLAAPSSSSSYAGAISYVGARPSFAPRRTVAVGNAAALQAAITDLRAGDLVRASSSFTVSGETIISNRLSAPAVLDLTGVRFIYSGGQNVPAVWLNNASNVRIYGGDLSTADTGGACLSSFGGQYVTWWGFTAHDCGGSGAGLATVTAAAEHNDFQGTIWKVGQNLAWDPHVEKGSGLHCVNLDDGGQYAFQDNRFAFYCHDIPTGAAIQYGSKNIAPVRNTIYLKAVNLTFAAQSQTGGNAIQFWGVNGQSADIKYLEVSNAQGYGLFDGGMYSGTSLSGVTLQDGHASGTNQNPRYTGQNPWDTSAGVVYKAVQPAP